MIPLELRSGQGTLLQVTASATVSPMRSRSQRFLVQGKLVAQVYAGYKWIQLLGRLGQETGEPFDRCHERSAQAIYDMAVRLEGLPIKVCQFLGSRADVLPRAYVTTLSQLQDRVPARDMNEIRPFIESEIGGRIEDLFTEFDTVPIASASLAQVHRARLRDGREVAVKVQYPEIDHVVHSDLENFKFFVKVLSKLERNFDFTVVIREVEKYVPLELDFENEAKNATKMRECLAARTDVIVPAVIAEHSSRRVLVMEYTPGTRVTDLEGLHAAGVDPEDMAKRLIDVFSEMILVHGFFHADPHPGNMLVRPDGTLVLLDFGLAKEFAPGFREGIMKLIMSIMTGDKLQIGRAFRELGFRTKEDRDDTLALLGEAFLGWALKNQKSYAEEGLLDEFNETLPAALKENPLVEVPGDILLVERVSSLLSGVGKQLGAHVDIGAALMPYLAAPPVAASSG